MLAFKTNILLNQSLLSTFHINEKLDFIPISKQYKAIYIRNY